MELLLQLSSQRLGLSLSWLILAFVLFFPTQSLAKCQDLEYPSELFFRGHSFTINDLYVFALNEGNICFKLNSPSAKKWHDLEILQEMKGKIRELSLDGGRLAARGEDDQIFLMRDALEEPKSFNWSGRWGVPFGRGNRSLYLPEDTKLWGFSYLSPLLDKSYTDSAGRDHMIGVGVSTVFIVREDGQTIDSFDPWLATNTSYGLCAPQRGRLRVAALSTSGSTLMVMDKFGNIFVRRFDVDIAGIDEIVFNYTYKIKRASSDIISWILSARKLPVPDWAPLPPVPGLITKRISMDRASFGARVRRFRVEGKMGEQNGYFQLDYDFVARSPDLNQDNPPLAWSFFETGLPLEGEPIENFGNGLIDLGPGKDQKFAFDFNEEKESTHLELVDFNERCSPAILRVSFDSNDTMDLILHTTDKMKFSYLDVDAALRQHGTVEIPTSLLENFKQLSARKKQFLKRYFNKKRFTKGSLKISKNQIIFKTPLCKVHWNFTKM